MSFDMVNQLWFAFKSVYLNYWKQLKRYLRWLPTVVICFQISIFELLETTNPLSSAIKHLLWFAFKSVYLNYWKQPTCVTTWKLPRCDLLSNQYIWTTGNNVVVVLDALREVVICFQISIFELLETTRLSVWNTHIQLWFAFKSVYLNYWKQRNSARRNRVYSCDLLSNQYIWTTGNNRCQNLSRILLVVICFQISIFELLETTKGEHAYIWIRLWFAFKSVYLNYWKQQ